MQVSWRSATIRYFYTSQCCCAPSCCLPLAACCLLLCNHRAVGVVSQLQRLVPGVVGLPEAAAPEWVEVLPSGVVLSGRLGREVWGFIETHLQQQGEAA